jgi:glycosyltransferase involved in cell wall biosynthesis
MKHVSIVIPTYNHAHFLERALLSVINQSYANWEILLVDNHSEDNTLAVIGKFNDPRIKHMLIHNHGIIAASRNLGIQNAKGEWIAFLDSDDYWFPDKLEVIMNAVDTNDVYDVYCTDEMRVNINTGEKKVLRYGPVTKNFYETMLVYGNRLSTSATVVRASFLKENQLLFNEAPDFVTVEDYDLWLNLARLNARFHFINEIKGEYVLHSTNSSAQLSKHINNYKALLRQHIYQIQKFEKNPDKLWNRVKVGFQISEIKRLILQKKIVTSVLKTIELFVKNPFDSLKHFKSKVV